MKTTKLRLEHLALILAMAAALLFWVIDGILDYLAYYNEPLLSVLFQNKREIYFRLLFTVCILSFGVLMARFLKKQRKIEEALQNEIAERQRSELSLQDGNSIQTAILNNIPDIAWLKDTESRYIAANEPFGKTCGFKPDDLVGKTDFDIWPEDLARLYRADDLEVMKTGRRKQVEEPLVDKNGEKTWVETVKTPIYNDRGEVIGTTGISRDVTERRRILEELNKYRHQLEEVVHLRTSELKEANEQLTQEIAERKKSEEDLIKTLSELAGIMETVPDMLVVVDRNGILLKWNKAVERICGFSADELKGRYVLEFVTDRYKKEAGEAMQEAFEKGYAARELTLLTKSGAEVPIAYSGAPLRDDKGQLIGLVCVGKDVSERKKIEDDLIRTEKLESLAILAGGIAHDFNNLLTAILGDISLFKVQAKTGRNALTEAEKAVYRARDLTKQLLTFSKGGEPVKRVVSVPGPVKDAFDFALRGSNIKCIFTIQEGLWRAEVDEGQISQVFHNLAINAVHAMPRGGAISVTFENVRMNTAEPAMSIAAGRYLKISVQDQGDGISEENLQKIFDPYFTTKKKGSGLGLATAYSIMKKHGGGISVESEPGRGSKFTIYLPASRQSTPELQETDKVLYPGRGKVLVMDDEEVIRVALGRMLLELGYEAEFAPNGEQAIEKFAGFKRSGRAFDAVIMDLTVKGGMGGLDCMKNLLGIDPGVKAIVSSGYSEDAVIANYRQYGFRGRITKPYQIEDLSQILHKVIHNNV